MQIVSHLLAFTFNRWCSHRAVKKEQSVTYNTPSELPTIPLVKIGYEPFVIHSLFAAQTVEDWTLSS